MCKLLRFCVASSDAHDWQQAMNNEINSLNKNKTWTLVDLPANKDVVDVKWIFKQKGDGTKKARLVARGFQQRGYVQNTYSPVFKMQTLKILLAFCCKNAIHIHQMDVETAFLNGNVKSEVYVKQPPGYNNGTSQVLKLHKALYGLKESPRQWYECFHDFLTTLKF